MKEVNISKALNNSVQEKVILLGDNLILNAENLKLTPEEFTYFLLIMLHSTIKTDSTLAEIVEAHFN